MNWSLVDWTLILAGVTTVIVLWMRQRKVRLLHHEYMSKSWMREHVYRMGKEF